MNDCIPDCDTINYWNDDISIFIDCKEEVDYIDALQEDCEIISDDSFSIWKLDKIIKSEKHVRCSYLLLVWENQKCVIHINPKRYFWARKRTTKEKMIELFEKGRITKDSSRDSDRNICFIWQNGDKAIDFPIEEKDRFKSVIKHFISIEKTIKIIALHDGLLDNKYSEYLMNTINKLTENIPKNEIKWAIKEKTYDILSNSWNSLYVFKHWKDIEQYNKVTF